MKHICISYGSFKNIGKKADSVDITQVPCTVLNMTFFNKLFDPENNIVRSSGTIFKRYDTYIDGFTVSDNLRGVRIFLKYIFYIYIRITILSSNIESVIFK